MRLSDLSEKDYPVLLHVDLDCFYAACERLREPGLRGEPVVVGMGYDEKEPKGAVATASYEAREFGVESAMPIGEALRRLPRMVDADADDQKAPDPGEAGFYRPVDMEFYKEVSMEVRGILKSRDGVFEPVGIDEAYLDVSGAVEWGGAESFTEELKAEVEEEAGLTASVGVAPTRSAAKVASDREKPDGLLVVKPGEVEDFFAPLDVEDIHGVGPVTASEFRDMGIETAGDLSAADPDALEERFGSRGREFYLVTKGVDPREVTPPDDPKSLSKEKSMGDATKDLDTKRRYVERLAQRVADRVEERDALYRTVGLKVVKPPFDVRTRERTFPGPFHDRELLREAALELLEEFGDAEVRKVGVRVSNLSFSEGDQSTLGEWKEAVGERGTCREVGGDSFPDRGSEKQERLDRFLEG